MDFVSSPTLTKIALCKKGSFLLKLLVFYLKKCNMYVHIPKNACLLKPDFNRYKTE